MAYRFYIAMQSGTPSVHVTWEECKKVQKEKKGVLLKGFNDFPSAVEWVEKKGGTLTEEDFPEYVLRSEPVLSKPIVFHRTRAVVEPDEIRVYTDGSCLSNPGGPGGFGSVILFPDKEEVRISGHEAITTNNRMEIMAVLSALDYIEQNGKFSSSITKVLVFSDSRYVVNIFQKAWISRWQNNGWITSNDKKVQNKDLLEILDWLVSRMRVRFIWVRGHNNNFYNEIADQISLEEAKVAGRECGFIDSIQGKSKKPSFSVLPKVDKKPFTLSSTKQNTEAGGLAKKSVIEKPEKVSKTVKVEKNSFLPIYNKCVVERQKRKIRTGKHIPQEERKAMFRIELSDGSLLRIPITKRQSEFIKLILGIHLSNEVEKIEMFDETTLDKVLLCKENPFPILIKEYQRVFLEKKKLAKNNEK